MQLHLETRLEIIRQCYAVGAGDGWLIPTDSDHMCECVHQYSTDVR